MARCLECDDRCRDDYDYCAECNSEKLPIDFDVIEDESHDAFKIRIGSAMGGDRHWLPKSQIEMDGSRVWVTRWLAIKKGLAE